MLLCDFDSRLQYSQSQCHSSLIYSSTSLYALLSRVGISCPLAAHLVERHPTQRNPR